MSQATRANASTRESTLGMSFSFLPCHALEGFSVEGSIGMVIGMGFVVGDLRMEV